MLVNLILHPKPNSVQWCCLSHLRTSLPHEKRRTYTFCAAASSDENTPECLSLFTLWDLRLLLKIKDTGVHQQMDVFMWFCAATMFKWDISLMLSLQLSRSVPRFYQTNEHSLKQTDSRASAWLGPPGGGVFKCILLSGRLERWHTVQTEESGCYQKPCRALLCCCCCWAT